MDGSLECKFLAYFGTISLTESKLTTLHPLLKGVHVLLPHMSSTVHYNVHSPSHRESRGVGRGRVEMSRFQPTVCVHWDFLYP